MRRGCAKVIARCCLQFCPVHGSSSLVIHLNDSETGAVASGIEAGYTCVTNASNSHVFTEIVSPAERTCLLEGVMGNVRGKHTTVHGDQEAYRLVE